MLNNKERDIIYKLIEEAKPTPSNLMGEKVFHVADMALYDELNRLEQKIKSSDSRYEPVSREEYEARGGK
tara:strand:- start:619 stop:828 length:210 start_codon:yes stop_codon:yes gene_type:complete